MEYAILFLPLIGSLIGYFGKSFQNILLKSLQVYLSASLQFYLFLFGMEFKIIFIEYVIFEWISSGSFTANWSINIDPLSSVMLVVVTFVSALVHIYSSVI